MKAASLTLALLVLPATLAHANYTIDLVLQVRSTNPFSTTPRFDTGFIFGPNTPEAVVLENSSPTDDFVTLTSPDSSYSTFVNHPDNSIRQLTQKLTANDALASASGDWQLAIDDGTAIHRYQIDVTLSPQVTTVPRLTSDRLTAGNTLGDFDWMLEDLNPTSPLADWSHTTQIVQTNPFSALAFDTFPGDETSWILPEIDTEAEVVTASLFSQTVLRDGLIEIGAVTPLTANAPSVAIGNALLRYSSSISSVELSVVPEPASASIAAIALIALTARLRRHA